MTEAAFWGLVTGSSLVIGAIVTSIARPRDHIVGLVMAFGAGALISAVAYEMFGEAVAEGDTEGVSSVFWPARSSSSSAIYSSKPRRVPAQAYQR